MAFDVEAFFGAVGDLSLALDKAAEMTGIPRAVLTHVLHRHAIVSKNKFEAKL
jgi:hypothetical protein